MAIQIFENQRSATSDVDEVSWLDGASPAHPLLGDVPGLQTIAGVIKQNLIEHLMAGCRVILESDDQPDQEVSRTDLEESLRREPRVWEAILLAQKYGVIYLMSRAEALHYQDLMQSPNRRQWLEPRKIDCYLRSCSRAIRAMNYAVYSFVTTGGLQVDHPPQLIPPNAISALGPSHIAVRRADFSKSISDILASDIVLYDLHDFAHLSAATVSAELYGSKYFDVLIKLDPSLTALIRSPGYRLATGSMISDGLLFSELLTGIVNPALEVALKRQSNHTYQSLTEVSAEKLAKYLLGLRPLWHPSTASLVKVDAPISPTELAILAQNKAYELPASEIDRHGHRTMVRTTNHSSNRRQEL